METAKNSRVLQFTVLGAFVLMIVVNALANILPINGVTTGEASDSYGNLFTPAGITFSIWGVIYLLLAAYTVYQLGLFQKDRSQAPSALLRRTGIIFAASSAANAAWIFSWHYNNIPLSMLLMLVILVCLILITQFIKKENLSLKEKLFLRLPFSIYFGWITVATVANATVLLVSKGWDGFGIPETVWACIILIVAMLIGCLTMLRNKDAAYGLVFIWAYSGILIKHVSQKGFAGQYPFIIALIILCIVVICVALILSLMPKKILNGEKTGSGTGTV